MAYINGKHTTVNVNVYGEIPETASGTVIYAVSMGLSRDCVVGRDYASELNEFIYPENIKAGDYMIDGDSACWFQYLDLEDGEASLGGYTNRVVCVANPNGKAEGGGTLTRTKIKIYPFSGMSNYYDENIYMDCFVTSDYVPDGTETYIFEPSGAIAPYFISAIFEPADYSGSGVTDSITYTIYCSRSIDNVSCYGTLTILK